jgi:hypothetical protein
LKNLRNRRNLWINFEHAPFGETERALKGLRTT